MIEGGPLPLNEHWVVLNYVGSGLVCANLKIKLKLRTKNKIVGQTDVFHLEHIKVKKPIWRIFSGSNYYKLVLCKLDNKVWCNLCIIDLGETDQYQWLLNI